MIYPRNGKEIVVPVYLIGDTTKPVGTLFSRYFDDVLEGARIRSYELLSGSSMVSLPGGDTNDARTDKVYINPTLIVKFGDPKLVDIPADIKSVLDEAYTISDQEDKTEEDLVKLKNDKKELAYYFSATRAYSI